MKKTTFRSHVQKQENPEGFNPRIYRLISIVFAVLSLVNLAVVIFAFNRSGYGLYHAEDALSHIAKIEQCLQKSNESVLNTVVYKNNSIIVKEELGNIQEDFRTLNQEKQTFREINLSSIDPTITMNFNDAMLKVDAYYSALVKYQALWQDDDSKTINQIEKYYETNIEPLKKEASSAMDEIVDYQATATYKFYVKVAQLFLLVIGFMLLTMCVGLNAISFLKNNAKKDAMEIQKKKKDALENAEEASHLRRKAVAIAYTNVLTGLKNRYALEEDTKKRLQMEDFTIAVFNFDHFYDLNERYGRNFGDMLMVKIADSVKERYSGVFDIYQTDTNELTFVLKRYADPSASDPIIAQIIEGLSGTIEISKMPIKLEVSGCIYRYHVSERLDINALFVKIDRAIKEARYGNGDKVLEVNMLYNTAI